MGRICGCGQGLRSVMEEWGCLHCGGLCCPTCGYSPEGTAYCPDCAQSLFGIHTRPAVVSKAKCISAWWEAAAAQPVKTPTSTARMGEPR